MHVGQLAAFTRLCAMTTAALLMACSSRSDSASTSSDDYSHLMAFDSATIRIVDRDTTKVNVELAESEAQHTMGLMERRRLAPDAGMLFLYSAVQPDSSAYWMYRTRIPLDIAFIDSVGVIRTILTMQPCPTIIAQGCPTYPARARFLAALEVNAGYFAAHRIVVGNRVVLSDTTTRRRAAGRSGSD